MEWPEDFPEDHAFVDLLVPGVSSDLDFEQLIKDTEEKLNLNANIEQQLKELQAKIGDSRTTERPLSPTEWLQWFSLQTQSVRPVTQGHQELMDFFRALVLGVLHSTLSSSQSSETGFDRLAVSFCSMVPVLTQALKEELHVLSRLAEPHTILGFINAAYLTTVATEFGSLMERECETAHRDNTAPSVKTKKYSVKSRATVG
uniref:Uncharacterized protein n=1 Tax=Amphilophus citrinellus TaxID=61819 RepID=A0A3Q0RES8_AMPCI